MGTIIKKKVYEKMSEGLHTVVITEVTDLGPQDTKFGVKDRIRVVMTAQDQKAEDGSDINVFYTATKSMHIKSQFGKLLANLGFDLDVEEFDVDNLVGLKFQIVVEHNTKDGETFANVASVLKRKAAQVSTEV